MSRAELVFRNATRNRSRTLLTVASVAVSIFLIVVFFAVYGFLNAPPGMDRFATVLAVTARTSPTLALPLHYRQKIESLPGVSAATPIYPFQAYYGGEDALMWAVAGEPEILLQIFFDWQLPEDQRRAFLSDRTALVAGRKLAAKYGWRLGDHIPLRNPEYGMTVELNLRGIYSSREDETMLAFHYNYLNEMLGRPNHTQGFWVLARTPGDVSRLGQQIDQLFSNQEVETRTYTMKQFALSFVAMLGNVKLILLGISAAVVFCILLIVTNTMAMSIRERTAELAVLRTLGFRTGQVLALLMAESLGISLLGATLGSFLAWITIRLVSGYQIGGTMPAYLKFDLRALGVAASVACGIALLSTFLPAYRASRLNIARALRFVG